MRTNTARSRRGLVVYQLLLILIAIALLIGLLFYLSKRAPATTDGVGATTGPALTSSTRVSAGAFRA